MVQFSPPGGFKKTRPLSYFGARGGGTVNFSDQLLLAFAASGDEGIALDGEGLSYGIDWSDVGPLELESNTFLRRARFRQLSAAGGPSVRSLIAINKDNLFLQKVSVDRNGDGSNGGLAVAEGSNGLIDEAFGVFISGGSGHFIEDLEVFGDDTGTGIQFHNLDHTTRIIRPYVHDIAGVNPDAEDDNIQGIYFNGLAGTLIEAPRVHDLTMTYEDGVTTDNNHNRALVYRGCSGLTIVGEHVENAGQGIDHTGSAVNVGLTHIGFVVRNVFSYGFKAANLSLGIKALYGLVERAGGAGYIDTAAFDADDYAPVVGAVGPEFTNEYINSVARDTGYGDTGVQAATPGFAKMDGTRDWNVPVLWDGCRASDNQVEKTSHYGFYSEAPGFARRRNCMSVGHITAAFGGTSGGVFASPSVHVRKTAAQTIPTASTTALTWDAENSDTMGMWSAGAPSRAIVVEPGPYRASAHVLWTANANGLRTLYIYVNGVMAHQVIQGGTAVASASEQHIAEDLGWLDTGTYVEIFVRQNTGGDLDTGFANQATYFKLMKVSN